VEEFWQLYHHKFGGVDVQQKGSKQWDKGWPKKEPGARLSGKAKESMKHFEKQREKMERIHKKKVTIICHKALLLPPGLFKAFTVKVNIPLRKDEIEKRMAAAFPEYEWRES